MRSRPTESIVVDNDIGTRRQTLDVQTKQVRRRKRLIRFDVGTRLIRHIAAQQQNNSAVKRPAAL